jgi:undecaprenyl-phosphate 4-deoxy-4-formamido-L-arabinose transferase
MKISVVIPCYNSENYISDVVHKTIHILEENLAKDYEIILINDGSIDGTLQKLKEISFKNKEVIVIDLTKNFGQANAMMAGYNYVTGDLIVHSDDDGQTAIEDLHKLINEINKGYDIVFGKITGKKQNSIIQNIATRVNNFTSTKLMGKPKNIHMGNFWVCRRYIIDSIIKSTDPNPYIAGLFLSVTKNYSSVPTNHHKRKFGKTKYTLSKMLNLWISGLTGFSILPLRIASLFGILTSIVGFFFLATIIIHKLLNPDVQAGYTSLMSIIIFFSGMIMLLLGIIGEYIGRIYQNSGNNSQYCIRNIYNQNQ